MRATAVALAFFVLAITSCYSTTSAVAGDRRSGIFCLREGKSLRVFGFRRLDHQRTRVAFSDWFPNGQHMGIYGVAKARGSVWVLDEGLKSKDPGDLCRVMFSIAGKRGAEIWGDPENPCTNDGGYGTFVRHTRFGPSTYEKPVTNEFDDAENFFGHAGSC